ncbi:unnamed protein product [Adineta ricciae]|uniref:UBA domain-containing protein n=1 Tax=Adineta ricciae TaxID=249248 RepID=A0A815SY18_ADIRI|nr:unnamed protein product [Adineta ricciae]CAF1498997.1 unnamed protein product [Adineta ricciae]
MTTMDCSTINNETLAHLVTINQMVTKTGCTHEQATQLLISTDWRLETAINLFFDERTVPIPCCKFSELMTPANTPATPPSFPETLLSLNKLSTSNGPSSSSTTTTTVNDNQVPMTATTTNHSLSSSPMTMNMMMMMMDGTA